MTGKGDVFGCEMFTGAKNTWRLLFSRIYQKTIEEKNKWLQDVIQKVRPILR